MKFIVNAHLPKTLVRQLNEKGHDAIHTRDMPRGNRSSDTEIVTLSLRELRVLVTKDTDFVDSLLIGRGPYKLLLITTGNISNKNLEQLFLQNLEQIERAFDE